MKDTIVTEKTLDDIAKNAIIKSYNSFLKLENLTKKELKYVFNKMSKLLIKYSDKI